jgi:hypothetical protein
MKRLGRVSIASGVALLSLLLMAAAAFGGTDASAPKPRLLPAVSFPRVVVPYGKQGSLIATARGVTRLLGNGAIDRSFGANGWFEPRRGFVVDVKLLAGGKVLVLTNEGLIAGVDPTVTRLLPSGALDRSFGDRGVAPVDFGHLYDEADSMTLTGGKIVVVGHGGESVEQRTGDVFGGTTLMRLKAGGAVDRSFASNGLKNLTLAIPGRPGQSLSPAIGYVQALPSGDLLLTERQSAAFVELQPDGTFEPDFGDRGVSDRYAQTELGGGSSFLPVEEEAPVLLRSGGFLLVGTVTRGLGGEPRAGAFRFKRDGTVDASYGNGGLAEASLPGSSFTHGAAAKPDGRLVVAASRQVPSGKRSRLAAVFFHPNGSLDTTIGNGGEVQVDYHSWVRSDAVILRAGGQVQLFGGANPSGGRPAGELVARVSPPSRAGGR